MTGIELQAIGDEVQPALLERLALRLSKEFTARCVVRPARLEAEFAWDAARNQYHSTAILSRLAEGGPPGARVLGVTSHDLFVPILTFVFGEAQVGGRSAVVSLHRLREDYYGLPPRHGVLEERLVKESVHELGHTYGLRHCPDWGCVMASTHSVELLDVKAAAFCDDCHKSLRRRLRVRRPAGGA